MDKPVITIITPFATSKIFESFLRSITNQTLPTENFELIVVVDSLFHFKSNLNPFSRQYSIQLVEFVRPVGFSGHSAGPARNLGASFAKGEFLLFIDSDCVASPHLLECYFERIQTDSQKIYSGCTYELPAMNWDQLPLLCHDNFDEITLACRKDHRLDDLEADSGKLQSWDFWYSCNGLIPKEFFQRIGGFDTNGYRCHDMELAYRLHKDGHIFQYLPNAKVIHVEHYRSIEAQKQQIQGLLLMSEKFPELSTYVFDQVLIKQRSQFGVAEDCEAQFLDLVKELEGYRCNYTWCLPFETDVEQLKEFLRFIPYEIIERNDNLIFRLGLHRNCWNYTLLLPMINAFDKPDISVVLPLYNSGEKVLKAINSVLVQTLQNFELIIVDDASWDESLEYIQGYLQDKRIRVYSLAENHGLSKVLNHALLNAKAPYLLQLDADDWLEPEALEKVVMQFSQDKDVGAVYGDAIVHKDGSKLIQTGYQIEQPIDCFQYLAYQVPRAYKIEDLIACGGWDISDAYRGRYYEDRLMLFRLSLVSKVKWMDERLYNVVDNEDSLSRKNGLTTASAKWAILLREALTNHLLVEFHFEGSSRLMPSFMPKEPKQLKTRWSIIIPFYKYKELLFYSVLSWLQSDFSSCEGEIIIVNDGSEESLHEVVQLCPRKIRIIESKKKNGPARARNIGAQMARYEMLFLSDADHIVPPDIISRHTEKHAYGSSDSIVVGCILGRRTFSILYPDLLKERKERLLEINMNLKEKLAHFACLLASRHTTDLFNKNPDMLVWRQALENSFTDGWLSDWGKIILTYGEELKQYPFQWTRLSTGSVSIKGSVFIELGGFDEELKSMEDWEFGIRAQLGGIPVICAPQAEPFHQLHPTDESRPAYNHQGFIYLMKKYPAIIQQLLTEKHVLLPPAYSFLKKISQEVQSETAKQFFIQQSEIKSLITESCVLTFDDGPNENSTRAILTVLNNQKIKGVFFVLGSQLSAHKELLKEMVSEGHCIGIHNWIHKGSDNYTSGEVYQMLKKTYDSICEITGSIPRYARPPYGIMTPSYEEACRLLNLEIVGWDISTKDWCQNLEHEIISRLASQELKGKILLFHDGMLEPKQTIAALNWLLNVAEKIGLTFTLLGEHAKSNSLPKIKLHTPAELFEHQVFELNHLVI